MTSQSASEEEQVQESGKSVPCGPSPKSATYNSACERVSSCGMAPLPANVLPDALLAELLCSASSASTG
eukprot:scaffold21404_cov32-Tisochrysis_lutea.AAC.1